MDVKKKKGRLKVDSARVLSLSGWEADVIDIDTYGSPWKHWEAMLPNITQDTTVFLTIGQAQMGTDSVIYEALGIGSLNIPPGIGRPLQDIALSSLLTMGYDSGIIIDEVVEAPSGQHARYLGVRLSMEMKS